MEFIEDSPQDEVTTTVNDDPDGKRFACIHCPKTFAKKQYCVLHTRIHTGEKPYTCMVCEKRFSDKSGLNRHSMIHTGEKPYTCSVCKKKFIRPRDLKMHIRIKHNGETSEKPFSCEFCNKRFSRNKHCIDHTRIHTGEKPYKCSLCNKSFAIKQCLANHWRRHTGWKPYVCDKCNKRFVTKSELVAHMVKHDDEKKEKRFACAVCDKKILSKSSLRVHASIHRETKKPFACTQCNRCFSRKDGLAEHISIHNNSFVCSVCDKKFTRKSRLDNHVCQYDRPTGEKPLVCLRCNNVIKKKYDLNNARNPFVCIECNTRLLDNNDTMDSGSKDHSPDVKPLVHCEQLSKKPLHEESSMGTRLPEKPFVCVECRESFPEKIELGDHYRITHNVCAECCKKFSTKYSLNNHLLKHNGEKQFICTVCNKTFNRKDVLDDHSKLSHPDETKYIATSCDDAEKDISCSSSASHSDSKHFVSAYVKSENEHSNSLENHYETLKDEKPFVCGECEQIFRQKSSLDDHYQYVHFVCPTCKKFFHNKQRLNSHILIHTGEKQFACSSCDRKFSRKDSSSDHMINVHNSEEKPYCCSECGHKFLSKYRLVIHLKLVHSEKEVSGTSISKKIRRARSPKVKDSVELVDSVMKASNEDEVITSYSNSDDAAKDIPCASSADHCDLKDVPANQRNEGEHQNLNLNQANEDKKEVDLLKDNWEDGSGKNVVEKSHLSLSKCETTCSEDNRLSGQCEIIQTVHLACAECDDMFPDETSLENHCKTNHAKEENPFICRECNQIFGQKCSLDDHYQYVHFVCPTCKRMCHNIQRLNSHMLIHTGEKQFACTSCDRKFRRKDALSDHILNVHNSEEKPYQCSECGLKFLRKNVLVAHLKLVHNDKEVSRTSIPKIRRARTAKVKDSIVSVDSGLKSVNNDKATSYGRSNRGNSDDATKNISCARSADHCNLKDIRNEDEHLNLNPATEVKKEVGLPNENGSKWGEGSSIHDDNKNNLALLEYEEAYPEKNHLDGGSQIIHRLHHGMFRNESSLENHYEKSFLCDECNQIFCQKSSLDDHCRYVHFVCPTCKRKCHNKQRLNSHMLIHTGEKQFACSSCDRKFRRKDALSDHILNVHNTEEKPYQCSECGLKFLRKNVLVVHLKLVHNDKEVSCTSIPKIRRARNAKVKKDSTIVSDVSVLKTVNDGKGTSYGRSNGGNSDDATKNNSCARSADHCNLKDISAHKRNEDEHLNLNPAIEAKKEVDLPNENGSKWGEGSSNHDDKKNNLALVEYEEAYPEKNHLDGRSQIIHWVHPNCDQRCEKFPHETSLGNHVETPHVEDEKPLICSECNKTFRQKSTLDDHFQYVHFVCPTCKRKCHNKQRLNSHMLIHTGEKQFACTSCDRKFSRKDSLSDHMINVHNSEEKPYQCSECGLKFLRKNVLVAHLKLVHNDKEVSCTSIPKIRRARSAKVRNSIVSVDSGKKEVCLLNENGSNSSNHDDKKKNLALLEYEEAYPEKKHLDDRSEIIHRVQPNCDQDQRCEKFPHETSLGNPVETPHVEDEKPLICSECNKTFRQKSSLDDHYQYVHFVCPTCIRKFHNKQRLNSHMLIHTGEKQFACSSCDRKFSRKDSLSDHMINVHNSEEKPYQCSECGLKFLRKYRLVNHMKLVHSDEEVSGSIPKIRQARTAEVDRNRSIVSVPSAVIEEFGESFSREEITADEKTELGCGWNRVGSDMSISQDNGELASIPGDEETYFICPECCLAFTEKSQLDDHLKELHLE